MSCVINFFASLLLHDGIFFFLVVREEGTVAAALLLGGSCVVVVVGVVGAIIFFVAPKKNQGSKQGNKEGYDDVFKCNIEYSFRCALVLLLLLGLKESSLL